LVNGLTQTLPEKPTLAVKSPRLLAIVTDVVEAGLLLLAANVPLVQGVVWLAPLTVMTPTSTFMLVVHETVALCEPDGGFTTQKIKVRMLAVVPESVPGIKEPTAPPRLAVTLVAPFPSIATIIMAARLLPLPMMNAGVETMVTPH
jgi:hypothetical protein